MLKIMIAVDGSEASLRATQSAIQSIAWYKQAPRIDLIAIHVSIPSVPHMGLVISQEMLDNYYREESEAMLARSSSVLDSVGVPYGARWYIGPVAETIVEKAEDMKIDLIYMGTRGMTAIPSLILGSTTIKVLHLTHILVVLIH
jgi:nucleotide-binding universal stress UspA family protein